VFLFVYEIFREPLNGFAPNSHGRRVWSFARTSLKVDIKGQRSRSPGTKNIFRPFAACVRFVFGQTTLACSCFKNLLQTLLYIVVGVATSVAVLIACAFSLLVLVPTLSQVTAGVDDSLDSRVHNAVNFSKYATNETYVRRDVQTFPI